MPAKALLLTVLCSLTVAEQTSSAVSLSCSLLLCSVLLVYTADATCSQSSLQQQLAPSWRSLYRALHADVRPPNGALATAAAHSGMLREDVIGRVVGGGACVWVALCRRSNGESPFFTFLKSCGTFDTVH
jgi:hypothetical protein